MEIYLLTSNFNLEIGKIYEGSFYNSSDSIIDITPYGATTDICLPNPKSSISNSIVSARTIRLYPRCTFEFIFKPTEIKNLPFDDDMYECYVGKFVCKNISEFTTAQDIVGDYYLESKGTVQSTQLPCLAYGDFVYNSGTYTIENVVTAPGITVAHTMQSSDAKRLRVNIELTGAVPKISRLHLFATPADPSGNHDVSAMELSSVWSGDSGWARLILIDHSNSPDLTTGYGRCFFSIYGIPL